MNTFESLVSRLQNACSSYERQSLLEASTKANNVFTCQQLGVILMALKYPAERQAAAKLLAQTVVDPENAGYDLRPFLSCESSALRKDIILTVSSCIDT